LNKKFKLYRPQLRYAGAVILRLKPNSDTVGIEKERANSCGVNVKEIELCKKNLPEGQLFFSNKFSIFIVERLSSVVTLSLKRA